MALFGTKKAKVEKVAKTEVAVVAKNTPNKNVGVIAVGAEAIIRPMVTEKSGILSQGGVYTFVISRKANKNTVANAIKALYKVTPVKVAIINNPDKRVFVRGKRGVVSGIRKAMITVKKGDKIDFI